MDNCFPAESEIRGTERPGSCDDVDFSVTPATNVLFTASMITSVDPGRNECHKDFVVENVPSRHIYGISMVLHVVATNTT